jgi:ABC-2 type transport system permease protein
LKKARAYLEFARKSFQNNIVYRVDYFAGVISTLVTIIVNIAIWKAIYGGKETINGVQFKMVVTNFILGLTISSIFTMNEYLIEGKIRTGSISTDLLKPISFRLYLLSHNLGDLFFKFIMQLAPTLIISIIFIGLLPPAWFFFFFFFFCLPNWFWPPRARPAARRMVL